MANKTLETFVLERPEQRDVLRSPIRLEILGQFLKPGGMSVGEIAERMGRPAASLYYHVELLEAVGILEKVGERRRGKRFEALYEPVADRFGYPADPDQTSSIEDAVKTMSSAFRMAEKDMKSALQDNTGTYEGPYRNCVGTRVHARVSKKALKAVNDHLAAIEAVLVEENQRETARKTDQYVSLTLALLPLHGRNKPVATKSGSKSSKE